MTAQPLLDLDRPRSLRDPGQGTPADRRDTAPKRRAAPARPRPPDCANAKEGQTAPSPGDGGGAETDALSIALARPITNDVPLVPSQREDPINAESVGPTYRGSLLRPYCV